MTPEEQLAYEGHIAQILAVRNPKRAKASMLETWLSSSVIVALVGVLGTGIFGAWITGRVQQRSKDNELQRASQQQRLADQNAAVLRILTLMANQSSAIDDLFTIVHNSYAEDRFKGQELTDLIAWKKKIRNGHDEADSTWRREKITAGYTLLYVFDNESDVSTAWLSVSAGGDAFETCANVWYGQFAAEGTDNRPEQICDAERKQLANALTRFTVAVAAKRGTALAAN